MEAKQNNALPWIMWILAACFYCYGLFLQITPSTMTHQLMSAFGMNNLQLGHLTAFYFYAYAIMQLPVGLLLDRYGPRRLITLAAITCAIGCWLFSISHDYNLAAIGRLITGFGAAFAAIGCLNIAAIWFPVKRFALLAGLSMTIGMLGITIGISPFTWLTHQIHWQNTMLMLSGVGITFVFLAWFILQDKTVNIDIDRLEEQTTPQLKQIIRNHQNWLLAIYTGLMFAGIPVLGALWGLPFVMQKCGLNHHDAAIIVAMLYLGWASGGPFWGWYSDYICQRKRILYTISTGALISITLAIYLPITSGFILGTLFFIFAFFSGGFIITFSLIREINATENNSGSLLGFMNTINIFIGGALAQPLVGWFLDLTWDGGYKNGVPIHTIGDFHDALAFIPIAIGTTLIILPFIRETFCQYVTPVIDLEKAA